jgi:hypothetical protein
MDQGEFAQGEKFLESWHISKPFMELEKTPKIEGYCQ